MRTYLGSWTTPASWIEMKKRLTKSRNKILFGVAAGVAEYFNTNPTYVRILFVLLGLFIGPLLLLVYLGLGIFLPGPDDSIER